MPNGEEPNKPPVAEAPKTEASKEEAPQPKPEEKPPKDEHLDTLLAKVKAGYEEKLSKQKADYEKRLKEREDVISQLLTGDNTPPDMTIAETINESREKELKW
jgi:hypothetical protein